MDMHPEMFEFSKDSNPSMPKILTKFSQFVELKSLKLFKLESRVIVEWTCRDYQTYQQLQLTKAMISTKFLQLAAHKDVSKPEVQ